MSSSVLMPLVRGISYLPGDIPEKNPFSSRLTVGSYYLDSCGGKKKAARNSIQMCLKLGKSDFGKNWEVLG